MADDNIVRSYRSNEPARRASAPAAPRDPARDAGGGDPLAELARLIGQSDPFADLDRNAGRSLEARQRTDSPPSDWRQTAAALARESMRDPAAADPRFEQVDSAITAARSLRASPHDQFAHSAAPARFDQSDLASVAYADNAYDDEPHLDPGIEDRFHHAHPAGAQPDGHENENYFLDGAAEPADDRFYDDPPRSRATNGLLTAVVLVGCGVLGTAGAYGYRTYYSGARATDAPIIVAEKSPNKMVPASAGADSAKPIQDRVGDKNANERVVARQEEPVSFSDASGPRVMLPAPITSSPGAGLSVQSNPRAPASASTEPKPVRTVAIRPEGVDPITRSVNGAGAPPQTTPSQPVAATRQSPPPAVRPASPPRNGGGPLSLEPQGSGGEAALSSQAPPRAATVPAGAATAPAGAPRLASASASSPATGGYVVQISSQRSEADAQASFHSLQSKFPRELGDREAIVRRADLGQKGIFYRAMVGPFGSAGDADQFCSGLKAAGGQCIVQKN
jgi:sporulation related protein